MNIILSLVLSAMLAGFAWLKKSLTPSADILAFLFSVLICLFGGLSAFLILLSTFAFTIIAGKISKAERELIEQKFHKKKGPRDYVQIICNVATGTLCLILLKVTGNAIFYYAYAGAMASSLADSLASELGILSKADPKLIFTNNTTNAGMSGGVTPWGFLCSLIGALIIAVISSFRLGVSAVIVITLAGFTGALADSIMGAYLQVRYKCPVCGAVTEKNYHCKSKGVICGGVSFLNNDAVNLMNNITGALCGALLCFLLSAVR